jgi:DNA-binding transcriptional LysR family regulator
VTDPFVLAFVPGVTPAKWVGIWKERMPRAPLELRPLPQVEALQWLREGGATVALVRLPVEGEEFTVIPLYSEVSVVVAAKDHPIAAFESVTLADLLDETLVDGKDAAAVELVAATDSIAIMPHSLARLHSRKDSVSRPITDAPETRVALVWLEMRTTPQVEEFVGIVRGRTANSSRGKR